MAMVERLAARMPPASTVNQGLRIRKSFTVRKPARLSQKRLRRPRQQLRQSSQQLQRHTELIQKKLRMLRQQ
jgi:hypothetical protein